MSSNPPSPRRGFRSPPIPEAPKESAVEKLLIAPITFFSFLVSLIFISNRNYALRIQYRGGPPPATFLGKTKLLVYGILYRPSPTGTPYVYMQNEREGSGEREPWHWHTKQRKMMKAEVVDALQIRRTVVLVLGGVAVAGVVSAFVAMRWVVRWGFGS